MDSRRELQQYLLMTASPASMKNCCSRGGTACVSYDSTAMSHTHHDVPNSDVSIKRTSKHPRTSFKHSTLSHIFTYVSA